MQGLSPALEACLSPLAEPAAGARSSPERELAREEIAKLESVAGLTPDWAEVERAGCVVLSTQAKDVSVAAYVALARVERAGVQGLSQGATLLSRLLREHAATLSPPSARARGNALGWFVERALPRVDALRAADPAALERASAAVASLGEACREALAEETPSLSALRRSLERLAIPAPAPVAVAAPVPTPVSMAVPVGARVEAAASAPVAHDQEPPLDASDGAAVERALRGGTRKLVELALARVQCVPADARAYRWLRSAAWLPWERAPGERPNGRSALVAPHPTLRRELFALLQSDPREALVRSESLLPKCPLWLELNHLSVRALEALGPEHLPAAQVIAQEACAFVRRIPKLCDGQFSDGTPFASEAVRAWLSPSPARGREPEHAQDGVRASFAQRLAHARQLDASGDGERARYAYLGLLQDVDEFALERWEPALARDVLRALCALNPRETPAGVRDEEARALHIRLARLAPQELPARKQAPVRASRQGES